MTCVFTSEICVKLDQVCLKKNHSNQLLFEETLCINLMSFISLFEENLTVE